MYFYNKYLFFPKHWQPNFSNPDKFTMRQQWGKQCSASGNIWKLQIALKGDILFIYKIQHGPSKTSLHTHFYG